MWHDFFEAFHFFKCLTPVSFFFLNKPLPTLSEVCFIQRGHPSHSSSTQKKQNTLTWHPNFCSVPRLLNLVDIEALWELDPILWNENVILDYIKDFFQKSEYFVLFFKPCLHSLFFTVYYIYVALSSSNEF